jgi:hypothetical protein
MPSGGVPRGGAPSNVGRYLAIFKRARTNPDPGAEDGWFSISLFAGSQDDVERWARHQIEKLSPWLNCKLEFVQAELHRPRPEMAGPYRGLIIRMD